MLTILITGFMLGFAGSLHCVGMCGPLSMALPTYHLSAMSKLTSVFVYQLGRIITYTLLGVIFGLAGRGVYLAGFQQWFSITLGIIILLVAVLYFFRGNMQFTYLGRLYSGLTILIGNILKQNKGLTCFLLLGLANGLLPCGMVYIALAVSLSVFKVYQGAGFMAMFGAGTLPAMILVAYSSHLISPGMKIFFRKSVPFFVTAAGLLLILRGLNLGIRFISPILPAAPGIPVGCP